LKKKGIEIKAKSIEILSLGSSHCEHGFKATLLHNAFNLGIVDQDLYSAHKIFDTYIEQLVNLKHVIVFYSIHSQGHELCKTNSRKYTALMHYIFGVPYDVKWLKKYRRAVQHRFKTFDDSKIDYTTFWGDVLEQKEHAVAPPSAQSRCAHHLRENRRQIKQNHHLFEMAETCLKKGIQFLIVIPPMRSDYLEELGKYHFSDEELFYEVMHWAEKHHVPVLNELHSTGYDWNDFYDSDHLNDSGAKKLTRKIANFINVK